MKVCHGNLCKWSEVWCTGIGEKKLFKVVWSSGEKKRGKTL